MVFVIHWHESDIHVFPIPIPSPTSLSTRSLWVFPVHQVRASHQFLKWSQGSQRLEWQIGGRGCSQWVLNLMESWFLIEEADPACHYTMLMGLSLSPLLLVWLLRIHTLNISNKLSHSKTSLHLQFILYFLHRQRPGSKQADLSWRIGKEDGILNFQVLRIVLTCS